VLTGAVDTRRGPGGVGEVRVTDPVDNAKLIASAKAVLRPRLVAGRLFGNVASTLITSSGNQVLGLRTSVPLSNLLPAHEWPVALPPR
jgi:hypothetical protein